VTLFHQEPADRDSQAEAEARAAMARQ
jgi:hypothetical protein